jgi:hypothetical protein
MPNCWRWNMRGDGKNALRCFRRHCRIYMSFGIFGGLRAWVRREGGEAGERAMEPNGDTCGLLCRPKGPVVRMASIV